MFNSEEDTFGLLSAFRDVSPIKSQQPKGGIENRRGDRYKATWRVAVEASGHDLHYAKINDISLFGVAILNDQNLKPQSKTTLHIQIPSVKNTVDQKILIVHGLTAYSIHDAKHGCFRIGINFNEFGLESDRDFLHTRLTTHHSKVPNQNDGAMWNWNPSTPS
jgi:hypothetical protein